MSKVQIKDAPQNATNAIQKLLELTKADMEGVNALIFEKMGSDVSIIPAISEHLINSGGKRLRPMLTLASAAIFNYKGGDHIKLAMAIEFMHTATLLHDDVVDESDLRRGQKTARKIWGNQASVLVGDFLLGQAFKSMVEVGSLSALKVLSEAAVQIAEGEVLQLGAAKNIETDENTYLKIIQAKTAVLFSAAMEIGAIIAGANPQQQQALAEYGAYLGMAFQLTDDALDYSGDSALLGKNVGDDFRDGKITLPIIHIYAQANSEEQAFLRAAFEGSENDDKALDRCLALMEAYNAIEATIDRAKIYGQKAREVLKLVPETPQKTALLQVIDFCIARLQ